jgi:hypothetical protein
MLQHVLAKGEHLEVVQELPTQEEVPSAIEQFDPEWVILSMPDNQEWQRWIDTCTRDYPSVRFIFLSPESHTIKLKGQRTYEEDLTNLSLKGFMDILEKDFQPT